LRPRDKKIALFYTGRSLQPGKVEIIFAPSRLFCGYPTTLSP
jgi:hypothetical protein